MNRNDVFWRKIIYISAIAALLIPLHMLGSPEGQILGGGYLAHLREKYGLAQVGLGEIDPASEAMRLSCLGLRGVAVNVLWQKMGYFKKTEQFDKMAATVDQILKLQPNFIKVWEYHAHNLSYNTSVEYDDFRFRYHWVKRGVEFLMGGIRYNRDNPRLLWYLGWFVQNKIGRSDEYRQFRPLFREDEDFHQVLNKQIPMDLTHGPDNRPDNWLVGYRWMIKAQDAVDNKGQSLGGKSPLTFHSSPSMSLMYYAMAIEEDGHLGEVGRRAWAKAGDSWKKYGNRPIPTSYGFSIRLNDLEETQRQIDELVGRLHKLAPGARQKLRQERLENDLTDRERAALEIPEEDRTAKQSGLALEAEQKLEVTDAEVADAAPAATRDEARRLAGRINQKRWHAIVIKRYREIVNFDYWRTRCEAEQTDYALRAREHVFNADAAFEQLNLEQAREQYELAWENWARIFEKYPLLLEDVSAEDVVDMVERYQQCLIQMGETMPDPFVLQPLLDLHQRLRTPPTDDATEEEGEQEEEADKPDEAPADEPAGGEPDSEDASSGETVAETAASDANRIPGKFV
jgi:hypothetical protein